MASQPEYDAWQGPHLQLVEPQEECQYPSQVPLFYGQLGWNNNVVYSPVPETGKTERHLKPGEWILCDTVELGWVKFNPETTTGGW